MPKLGYSATQPLKYYLGIDPGQSGGLALIDENGKHYASWKMPESERFIWDVIDHNASLADKAVIEQVHSFPGQGVASTFKFGVGYGGLRMALIAAYVSFEEVNPRTWQKALGIKPMDKKQESHRDFKKRLQAKAQQLFPTVTVTLAIADALLLAEYCRRKNMGLL